MKRIMFGIIGVLLVLSTLQSALALVPVAAPIPSQEGRLEIFKIHTKPMPLTKDADLNKLAEKTKQTI